MKITAILLAAGQGVRMRSRLPKVLHPVAGMPLILHALQSARQASTEKPVVIVGHGAGEVIKLVADQAVCILQEQQLGTGHAVQQAERELAGKTDLILVTYADMPLLRAETLQCLVETQKGNPGPLTLLTIRSDDPRGFGRILRGPGGNLQGIVEEALATPEQLENKELNVGAYCFSAGWLWQTLHQLQVSPRGEYFLTDTIEVAVRAGLPVMSLLLDDLQETIGVNNRIQLAQAEAAMRQRINHQHMLAGVTLIDPDSTYIDAGVTIGMDTLILPNTSLQADTKIGRNCVIGPNSIIRASQIGDSCTVVASMLEGAHLDQDVDVGPFARLRRGARLEKGVHVGNFGEVKDSTLGAGTKMGHFSYIGNATIGPNVNIGAGTITANFDGEHKNPTEIGEDVFIGSDTLLIAPVKIGDRARTGAGSVVTRDVPADTLAVGMPARAIRKLEKKKDE